MTPAATHGVRLATRGSVLARSQTRLAAEALRGAGVTEISEVLVRTASDRHPDVPLERLEGQGWFVTELERALQDGAADIAVHSAKDLPSLLGAGLCIAAHLPRADPRDAAVTVGGGPLSSLPEGSRVGTGSPRRRAFLESLHPHLRAVPIRGNVDTRLRKLESGEVEALLLAAAGLDRLNMGDRAAERLDPTVFVPAPAQGVIGLEAVCASAAADLCAALDDPAARAAVTAERAVLEALGGGCLLPLGVWARLEDGRLAVTAALASEAGIRRTELTGDPGDAVALGARVAAQLL